MSLEASHCSLFLNKIITYDMLGESMMLIMLVTERGIVELLLLSGTNGRACPDLCRCWRWCHELWIRVKIIIISSRSACSCCQCWAGPIIVIIIHIINLMTVWRGRIFVEIRRRQCMHCWWTGTASSVLIFNFHSFFFFSLVFNVLEFLIIPGDLLVSSTAFFIDIYIFDIYVFFINQN